jgi:transcriptional regulator with XRE-family HTH domain
MTTVANKVDFQDWLQTLLDEMGWGQSELASKAGVDRQIVHGWLKLGKKPSEENLQRIAKAFDVPPETVYRAAGMKLSPATLPPDIQQAAHEMEDLAGQDRAEVIAYIKMLKNLRKKNER